jgi:hypothetical protein
VVNPTSLTSNSLAAAMLMTGGKQSIKIDVVTGAVRATGNRVPS